jgi:hypothetical protein
VSNYRSVHLPHLLKPNGTLAPLTIFFDVDTFDVLWFCPNCDDNGRISGWEGTFWDSSEIAESTS